MSDAPPDQRDSKPEGPPWWWSAVAIVALVGGAAVIATNSGEKPTPEPGEAAVAGDAMPTGADAVQVGAGHSATKAANAPTEADDASAEADDAPARADDAPLEAGNGAPAAANADTLHIVASPAQLRVWANTTVALELAGPTAEFDTIRRVRWRFEDGSEPAEGRALTHTFPESVRDRFVTARVERHDDRVDTISLRLPIERLDVVPLPGTDAEAGAAPEQKQPAGGGATLGHPRAGAALAEAGDAVRLAWVRGPPLGGEEGAALAAWLGDKSDARALFVGGTKAAAQSWVRALSATPTGGALAVARVVGEGEEAPLQVVHDPEGRLPWGDAEGGLLVVDGVAVLPLATAGSDPDDARVAALASRLADAAPYTSRIMVSWRSLSAWTDEDPALPLAYRIYEHALREEARAFVSYAANVPCDGRYGGLTAISVGPAVRAATEPCHALRGSRDCVSGAITLVDVPREGSLRIQHASAADDGAVYALDSAAFPPTIGRYRR